MRDCKLKTWLMGALCWGVCQVVNAQLAVATVNGVTVPATLLEQVVRNNAKQDITDTPELRQLIRNELILREVLSQEATRRGLDKTEEWSCPNSPDTLTFCNEVVGFNDIDV